MIVITDSTVHNIDYGFGIIVDSANNVLILDNTISMCSSGE